MKVQVSEATPTLCSGVDAAQITSLMMNVLTDEVDVPEELK